MLTESCINCDADVPLSGAVHILVNPKGDEEVTDGYLCTSCYEAHVEPLLPEGSADAADEAEELDEAEEANADGPDEGEDRDDRPLEEA